MVCIYRVVRNKYPKWYRSVRAGADTECPPNEAVDAATVANICLDNHELVPESEHVHVASQDDNEASLDRDALPPPYSPTHCCDGVQRNNPDGSNTIC